jgi:glycosyltransferase involved in cell wall biosynthesis
MAERMKILYYSTDFFGCGWYRCHVPGVALRNLGGHEVAMSETITFQDISYYDVIVFQRRDDPGSLNAIRDANRLGKLTVYEVDDDIFHIDAKSTAFEYWKDPKHRQGAVACARECFLFTTSTKTLTKVYRPINKNIVHLPNMIPEKFFNVEREKHPGKVVVGWAGGAQHFSDLIILKGVLEQILDDYDFVEVVLSGMPTYPFKPHPRGKALPWTNVENYPRQTLSKFDIGLAPLVDNAFNRGKSDLKFIEYGYLGIPMIGSPVQPYVEAVEHGKTGFLAKTPKDWLKYLKRLIENEDLRKEIGENARKVAEKRTIEKNYHLWEKVYWENLQKVRQKAQTQTIAPPTPPAPPFQFPAT